jgi:predicted esterase
MGATKLKKDAPFWQAGKQNLRGLLGELLLGKKFEGDIPVKRLVESMGFLEKGLDAVDDKKGSEYLVALPGRVAPLPVRIFIPASAKVAKVPLVVALHGAGATENMFFEAYGVGKVKTLCNDRGWMLVAPRNGITIDNLRMLIQELPIDPEQIIFIGHSMGAGQALEFAVNHSKEVKALGLMGGAGAIGKNQSLGTMPVFVGVGSEDFSRAAVAKFSQEAIKQPENKLVFKEYESIEHSSICQVCLPEMFDFFSMILKK